MPFAYYGRLSTRDKETYPKSDAIAQIRLAQPALLHPLVAGLRAALEADDRAAVAFRTFLRTLLHEVVHHLDYTHLKLAESFHTEGFFKRESSLFKQLVGE